ncbi:type II secretion system protein N (plasmid) [Comamonas aquatica]|nr:type II secretion system protein N [Comamonas aquatica]
MAKFTATHASIAGGVLGLAIGCVVAAPASWLAKCIEVASNGQVQLHGAQGTVWNGSALLTLTGGAGSSSALTLPSRLVWTLTPSIGSVAVELNSTCCTAYPIRGKLTPRRFELEPAATTFPLELMQGLGAPWNSIGVAGKLELRWEKLSVSLYQGSQTVTGRIDAVASKVSTKLSTLPDVGTYQLTYKGGDKPQLTVSTKEGQLLINGLGHWSAGKFSFEGTGQAKPESVAALANFLTLLGDRSGDKTKIRFGKK